MRYLYPIVVAVILIVAIYIIQAMIALPEPLGQIFYIVLVLLVVVIAILIILELYLLVTHKDTL